MPDDIRTESLAAASQTLLRGTSETETLRAQLAQAASLLAALAEPPAGPSLVFRRPGQTAAEGAAIGDGVKVGRGEGCAVRFEGRSELSREHFAVRAEGARFVVEDLGSSNGTTIEGVAQKLGRRELRDGDLIRAGGIVFLFVRG
jgi:hypothetical protein